MHNKLLYLQHIILKIHSMHSNNCSVFIIFRYKEKIILVSFCFWKFYSVVQWKNCYKLYLLLYLYLEILAASTSILAKLKSRCWRSKYWGGFSLLLWVRWSTRGRCWSTVCSSYCIYCTFPLCSSLRAVPVETWGEQVNVFTARLSFKPQAAAAEFASFFWLPFSVRDAGKRRRPYRAVLQSISSEWEQVRGSGSEAEIQF